MGPHKLNPEGFQTVSMSCVAKTAAMRDFWMSFQQKRLHSACFGCKLVCHTPMRKLLPWEQGRPSSSELPFEGSGAFRDPAGRDLLVNTACEHFF